MQKALSELEREGLVYSQRTAGRFVADMKNTADDLKESLAVQHMKEYLESMGKIGYTKQKAVGLLAEYADKNSL